MLLMIIKQICSQKSLVSFHIVMGSCIKILLPKLLFFSIIYMINYAMVITYQIQMNNELYDIGWGGGYFINIGFKIFVSLLSSHILMLYSFLIIYVTLSKSHLHQWKS
ncbi:MAG: hypothetical protein ACRCWI_06370 [Brevinema sp.]